MPKMKIGKLEGDAGDLERLIPKLNIDCNRLLGLPKPVKPIPIFWMWLIIPLLLLLTSCIWVGLFDPLWTKVSIIGMFFLYITLVILVHYNFAKWSLTALFVSGGLIFILLALNVYTPQEVAKKIEQTTIRKYSK